MFDQDFCWVFFVLVRLLLDGVFWGFFFLSEDLQLDFMEGNSQLFCDASLLFLILCSGNYTKLVFQLFKDCTRDHFGSQVRSVHRSDLLLSVSSFYLILLLSWMILNLPG